MGALLGAVNCKSQRSRHYKADNSALFCREILTIGSFINRQHSYVLMQAPKPLDQAQEIIGHRDFATKASANSQRLGTCLPTTWMSPWYFDDLLFACRLRLKGIQSLRKDGLIYNSAATRCILIGSGLVPYNKPLARCNSSSGLLVS